MEVGTEISQKIRSAIKAKLMEIGSYVDDELPDYIMVMVANKKTQQQMSNDLSLFLGANTDVFTTWLHGLLVKLQTVSGDSKSDKSKSSKDKKKEKKSKEGVESKKEKRKVSKKSDVDSGAPKAKSARTTNTEKNGADALQTKDAVVENLTNNQSPENEGPEQAVSKSTKSVGDSKQDDIEDVRQLLVTETPSDELAEELEKSEEGIEDLEKLSSSSNVAKKNATCSQLKSKDILVEPEGTSGREVQTDAASSSRKRKCPSSVVAAVRRDDDVEDDHSTPMVASVVKVTSRKSSVPQSMQANRALLVKAINEAERSIAVKRKIAVAKPISREESPSEIYTPKRRKSESATAEVSPPPYIPSRKDSSSTKSKSMTKVAEVYSSSKDARQLLEKREHSRMLLSSRDRRELISRSRRLELFHKLGIDRKEVPDVSERRVKDDEEKASDRRIERDQPDVVRNFKITATVAPSSRLSQSAKERLAKALEDKERQLKITVLPTTSSHKSSVASRLGKIVVQQRSSEDRDQDPEPSEKSKAKLTSRGRRLALTLLGKEVVKKQCEAAVLSVKSSSTKVFKRVESMDSRVVESHKSSDEDETSQERSSVEILQSREERKGSVKSDRDSLGKDSEDLDDMLKDDIDTDLLNETLADEFTLDLDDDDEDLIKVVGQLEEEDVLPKRENPEVSSGTRFIVTLDGVDERQFEGHRESDVPDSGILTYNSSQLSSPNFQQLPAVPKPPDQATFLLPSDPSKGVPVLKTAPPKIQPFSINLKDSDDEFDDKAETKAFSKMAGYQHPVKPIVTGIVDPTISLEQTEGLTALQKAKMAERCKFWPACAAGSECKFHHPTSYCKTFPNCKFGDKCLFIHPNCKFDSKCTRIDCPFTHTSRRPALGTPPQPVKAPVPAKPYYPQYIPLNTTPQPTVCKFFPNCNNVNCAFIHPRPCRFGLSCQSPGCPFYHPSTPSKDKLKWSARPDQVKEMLVSPPTQLAQTPSKPHTLLKASSSAGSAAVSSTNMWLK